MKFKQLNILLMCILLYSPIIGIEPTNQEKLNDIQEKIKKNNSIIKPKKNKKKKAEVKLNEISRKIKYNELKLNNTKRKLVKAINKEKEAKENLADMHSEYLELEKELKKRIKFLYKHSPLSIFELILSKNRWSIESNSIYFFSKILQKDVSIINKSRESLKKLEKKKALMEKRKKETLKIKKYIQKKRKIIIITKKSTKSIYFQIKR